MSDETPVRPGEVVGGKYRVERVLGQGGMGVVVAATHLQLGGKVALKFLLPHAAARPAIVARFRREARAAASITSEHVAHVHDVGVLPSGVPYLVMEHLEGMDFGRLIGDHGARPIAEAVDYMLQACEALAEAHALGIVHRDLKAANLFLTRRADGSPLVKVLDFGIAKLAPADDGSALTSSHDNFGTPAYMAPEQIQSAKRVDARSDIWALGVILYELLVGARPFEGDSAADVLVAVLTASPAPPHGRRPDLPAALGAAILRCLDRDPGARFGAVSELATAIAPFGSRDASLSLERVRGLAARPAPPPIEDLGHEVDEGTAATELVTTAGHAPEGSALGPQGRWATTVNERTHGHWRRRAWWGAALVAVGVSALAGGSAYRRHRASLAPLDAGCARGDAGVCEKQCDAGNAAACTELAYFYKNGKHVGKDLARGCALAERACAMKSAVGCNDWGVCFDHGQGDVAPDAARAAGLYEGACEQGAALACGNLGALYAAGKGVARDDEKALRYFTRGCDGLDAASCYLEARAYATAKGVDNDMAKAASLDERGCAGGDARACAELVALYEGGVGVARDAAKAVAFAQKACDAGNGRGCASLGRYYASGEQVPKDAARAAALFRKACDAGAGLGCLRLGLLATDDAPNAGVTPAGRAGLFEKACDAGVPDGCLELARLFERGNGVAKDPTKAFTYFGRACDGEVMEGCVGKGVLLFAGRGVTKDVDAANDLWRRACDAGWAMGCETLAMSYKVGAGFAPDPARAAALFTRACDVRGPNGCVFAAAQYRDGVGVPRDAAHALVLLRRGCDGGVSRACHDAASLALSGKAGTLERSVLLKVLGDACNAREKDQKACDEQAKRLRP